jgi:hypothetical protein
MRWHVDPFTKKGSLVVLEKGNCLRFSIVCFNGICAYRKDSLTNTIINSGELACLDAQLSRHFS